MARKTVKRSPTAKSKKSPKVGNSKKAKTIKSSRAKKQTAKIKSSNTQNKLKKISIAEKKSKSKKNKRELKKTSRSSSKASLSGKKKTASKIIAPKKVKIKSVKKTNKINPKKKTSSPVPSLQEIQESILRSKREHEEQHNNQDFLQDNSKAPGKKHLDMSSIDKTNHSDFEMNKRNELAARPEAYGKHGRSTSPRATYPTS